ncbi:MAG: SIR2 family protein [Chloroflexi bacterium]|nr:SIR2 family protein [Chloroflexota bacterium]MBI3741507.1 SIR2 family protein [Chloroflexota bacterium]
MAEPPYGVIWNRMKTGMVVPFLGAGASFVGRPPNAEWKADDMQFLPSGRELSNFLAVETSFPSDLPKDRDDLSKVSSYYADISGRRTLRERLREVFVREYPRGALHDFLAAVPAPMVAVVTNYDTLLEQAFRAVGKPYDLVIYPADRKDIANAILWWPHGAPEPQVKAPNELDIDLSKTSVIYKMHGTIHPEVNKWDNFVITEEDYVEFLSRMTANTAVPSIFYEHFRERSFLFLGYSLGDWNLRVILKNLSKYLSKRTSDGDDEVLPSWSIQFKPSELDRKLWEKRNVNIFDIAIDEFVAKLSEQPKK